MASRQEEKERRRQERMAKEAAEKRAAARAQRMRIVGGALIAVLIAAGAAFAITQSGGDDGDGGPKAAPSEPAVELPEPRTTNLEEAVKAAGCELKHPKYEGAGHDTKQFTPADYKTNPPTSGAHNPTWYEDGIYEPGTVPELGKLVHTLEHGRINVQYKPGTPSDVVAQLEAFAAEKTGYHMLLYENTTNMPYEVAASAWTHLVGCKQFKPEVIDVLRTFYDEYVDKGPEQVA